MKKIFASLFCGILAATSLSAQTYEYKVDLNEAKDDILSIELKVPALKQKDLYFQMPAMVPGTYSVYDFGRFVTNFKAFDTEGKELTIEHSDANTWKIVGAKNAAK